jgi:hypothetical protein
MAGGREALSNTKASYATPEAEQRAHEAAVAAQIATWRQHLPDLFAKLARIPDVRRSGSVRHRIPVLCFYRVLLFVFPCVSRREANHQATGPTLAKTLHEVFPDLDSIPHFDTGEDLLHDRIQRLLRRHAVREYFVQHAWVVAVDGTQKFARHQPFASVALQQRVSDTETRYRIDGLEAVLVAADGATLPLLTEFAENPDDAPLSKAP